MASHAVHRSRGERGAALIIAVGILTILLVIGATFFRISQTELQVATNVTDQVRMDLMAEGATSVAVAFLRQDRIANPTATSLDHPWNTYFNGAWAAGKPWMWEGTSSFLINNDIDDDGDGEIDNPEELFIDPSADGVDNDGDGAANPDELFEGRDFVAGAIPVVRLRPDGTVAAFPPVNPNDIPDPPDFRFPRDADGDPYPDPTAARPLETNLGGQLYIPRVEDVLGPPQLPLIDTTLQPRYTLSDLTSAYDVPDGDDEDLDGEVDEPFENIDADHPWVVARNRAGGDFGVSPVYDADGDPTNNDPAPLLTEEQIALWADVDNDGDGVNDSVWLPVSAIRVLDNDGIDNNLNGVIDEPGELGIFIYNAANDGVDNDGDGIVDNEHLDAGGNFVDRNGDGTPDENDNFRIMFTTHFRSFLSYEKNEVDDDGDGTIDEPGDGDTSPGEGILSNIPNFTPDEWERAVSMIVDGGVAVLPNPAVDVDVLDNDHTLIVNDRSDMARYLRRFEPDGTYIPGPYPTLNDLFDVLGGENVQVFAEPVSEITGRMAVKITDISTKVNINAAGGHSYRDLNDPTNDDTAFPDRTVAYDFNDRLRRSMSDGLKVSEYETRVLPDIGDGNAQFLWTYRMGVPQGDYAWDVPDGVVPDYLPELVAAGYEPDITTPGYGYVDDDGNALWLSLNGLDDDGNGLADDGIVPHNYAGGGDVFADWLEGIDEPGEWQRFQPLRNTLAEDDGLANTGIGDPEPLNGVNEATVEDFLGELGDTYFRTHESTKNIVSMQDIAGDIENEGINAERFSRIEPFITVHSTDRNIRFEHAVDQNFLNEPRDRSVTGVRLDINVVDAERIRDELIADFGYRPVDPERVQADGTVQPFADADAIAFALGLKRGDITVEGFDDNAHLLGQTAGADERLRLRHDPRLRAAQLAVNTQDFRDIDRVRSEISTFFDDPWWPTLPGENPRQIEYVNAGIEAVRINELMVRPVRRIEAEMDVTDPNRDPNAFSDALSAAGPVIDDDFLPIYDPATAASGRQMADRIEALATIPPNYDIRERWYVIDNQLLGLNSAWRAFHNTIRNPDYDLVINPGVPESFPNVIEFSFEASPQLPPGRYYLTLNTVKPLDLDAIGVPLSDANAEDDPDIQDGDPSDDRLYFEPTPGEREWLVTLDDSTKLLFATKYVANTVYPVGGELVLPSGAEVTAGTTDIIEDVYNAVVHNTDFHQFQIWQHAIIGYRDSEDATSGLSGWAFLPTNAEPDDNPDDLPSLYGYFQNSAYTVEIPNNDADRSRLHVAFLPGTDIDSLDAAGNPDPGLTLDTARIIALNFFDFSQEPDHEYIELINIDQERAIDIGGWAVTVDGETILRSNNRRRIMTIPQNTTIAPGGSLLLVSNKQDVFASEPENPNLLDRNGMGSLRNSGVAGQDVTVPDAGVVDNGVFEDKDFDADSIWAGTGIVDFVDNDGDGIEDPGAPNRPDDDVDSDGDGNNTNIGDRIIELEIPELNVVTDVQRLAQIVLGGGIFPNYPERDGIDNDLDNRILENDLVDNNGSGTVDDANEGIDEGFRLHYLGHPGFDTAEMPGGFGAPQFYRFDAGALQVLDPDDTGIDPLDPGDDPFTYLGSTPDSPVFRAFVERRWYPGDNVIVTLYEDSGTGTGADGPSRIVDRVTYNEIDVINRSIDDLINVTLSASLELDPDYPTFWPHDTMGIDFYKSLERKHPLYNGDRFGTTNRWQATDGNYDDWADRTSRLERVVNFDFDEIPGIDFQSRVNDVRFNHAFNGSPLRANLPHRLAENLNGQFEDNDISDTSAGSEETPRQWAFNRVDVVGDRSRPMLRAPSQLMRAPHMVRKSYLQSRPQAVATGTPRLTDIDSVNVLYEQDGVLPVDSAVRQDRSIQQVLMGQTFPAPDAGRVSPVQTGGPNDPEVEALRADLPALTSIFAAHTSQSLTAGQARVFPMWPFPLDFDLNGGGLAGQVDNVPDGYRWEVPAGPGITPPSGWSPVHLWSLPSDDDANPDTRHNMFVPAVAADPDILFARRYLMFPPVSLIDLTAVPQVIQVDTDRWPLDKRGTMYVSGNLPPSPSALDSTDPNFGLLFHSGTEHIDMSGTESLFVWTGEDGLENGEYDVYVMLNEPVRRLNEAHLESDALFGDDLLTNNNATDGETNFGRRFMETALANQQSETSRESVLPEDVVVDIDFFTDRNGDRKVWNLPAGNPTPGIPKPGSLNDGFDDDLANTNSPYEPHPTLLENFGLQPGVSPGTDGIYHYPLTVTVENNYLAMFLRNRTQSGTMIRFSRIILAPRDRTPGKLNINTIVTSFAVEDSRYMNTLVGIPGLNRDYDLNNLPDDPPLGDGGGDTAPPTTGVYGDPPADDSISTQGVTNEGLLGRVSKIALGRTDHVDGRYYDFLIDGAIPFVGEFTLVNIQGSGNDQEPVFSSFTEPPGVLPGARPGTFEEQFDEVYERYTRTENLITTRSDVFEILVTVQTGTVTDRNGDGVLNYRDDFEFTVTGERQMRTVYER